MFEFEIQFGGAVMTWLLNIIITIGIYMFLKAIYDDYKSEPSEQETIRVYADDFNKYSTLLSEKETELEDYITTLAEKETEIDDLNRTIFEYQNKQIELKKERDEVLNRITNVNKYINSSLYPQWEEILKILEGGK